MDTSKSTSPASYPSCGSSLLFRRTHQHETNQIHHIKLGFSESRLNATDYAPLCKALRVNKSLKAVEIGLELPRPTLLKILDSVVRLPCLQSLSLIGLTNLPRRLLQLLVSKPGLHHLVLRNNTIAPGSLWKRNFILHTVCAVRGGCTMTPRPSSPHDFEHNPPACDQEQQRPSSSLSRLVKFFANSIQSLHLSVLDFDDYQDLISFCDWTERRSRPLDNLSFAFSNSMPPQALETLVSCASCRQLDLTACGLSDADASVIALCLPQSKTIETMIVAQNPSLGRLTTSCSYPHCQSPSAKKDETITTGAATTTRMMGTTSLLHAWPPARDNHHDGFDKFMHVAMKHLKALDLSYCSLSLEQACNILQLLVQGCPNRDSPNRDKKDQTCFLESLIMFGVLPTIMVKHHDNDDKNGGQSGGCGGRSDDKVLLWSLIEQVLRKNAVLKSLQLLPRTMRKGTSIMVDGRMRATTSSLSSSSSCMIMSDKAMAMIACALEDNYTLEDLQVGQVSGRNIRRIDHLLSLNRAGRRFLRYDGPNHDDFPVDWATVLSRGSDNPDVLFWLLQNGLDRIIR